MTQWTSARSTVAVRDVVGPDVRIGVSLDYHANVSARLLAGGRRNPDLEGYFYEPTVLTDVTHEMRIMREETFGPVLPIMRTRDVAEALRHANDSRYGLHANVWTRNKRQGLELATPASETAAAATAESR